MRKLSSLVALALVSTLIISAPGNANPGRGNSANAPGQQATPTVTVEQGESAQAATERANRAAAAAAAAKEAREAQEAVAAEAARQKGEAEAKAKSEAAQAAQAAQAAARAERDNPAAAPEARERADSAQANAAKAADEAKGKAAEAQEKAGAVREAKKEEIAAIRVARALGKIKSANEDCLEFVENPSSNPECQTTRYVIRFQNGVDPDFQVRGMRSIKIPVRATLRGVFSGAVADLNAGQLRALVNSSRIRSVEADFEVKLAQTQNNAVWGIDRVDQPALPLSNTFTSVDQGAGVRAYVVDTGVLTNHQEFSGRVLPGFSAISDGRGVDDCNGHGTHVAGTIAGTSYGVAKAASIVPVRVLDCNGSGFLSSVVAGLDFVAQNNAPGAPAVVNLSLGGGASSTLDAAVENLVSRGITVVVAAGNSAISACDASPARTPGALTIAASDINDRFATFSNFGSCVDMVAPGVSVTSAWITSNTSAAVLSGTSMAAPHVAGLAAVLMTNGYLQPNEVEFRLESAAVATVAGLPAGTPHLLAQLVSSPIAQEPVADEPADDPTVDEPAPSEPELPEQFQTAPVAPTITSVNLFRNTARVFWNIAPDGGSPLTGHVLRIWERGQLVKKIEVSATATDAVARGLKWGVNYTFTVLAVNAIGTSEDSQVSEIFTPRR
jgi:subtilisin family serine protease